MIEPFYFVVPGSLDMRTGGYGYDRRILKELKASDIAAEIVELDGVYPFPSQVDRQRASERFGAMPDGALVLVDGLAFGALPEIAEREAKRLRLVALVHHPLADETGVSGEKRKLLSESESAALACAGRIIVTSSFTRRRLENYGIPAARVSVVEPGTEFAPPSAGSGYRDGSRSLSMLCPASYIPRKGHGDLFAALAGLVSRDWSLTCVGNTRIDLEYFMQLCALAETLGLKGRVTLREEVEDEELGHLYEHADLVVLASLYEGYGMVVSEAIARGIPVITTTGGALADTLPKGAGLASAPGDVPALRENFHRVLSGDGTYHAIREGALAARQGLPTWQEAGKAFATVLGKV